MDLFENYSEYVDKKVEIGIEAYRKGDAFIKVVDADGKALKNANVKVKQKKP